MDDDDDAGDDDDDDNDNDDDDDDDDVEEEDRPQDREPHFVRACAVEMHMDIFSGGFRCSFLFSFSILFGFRFSCLLHFRFSFFFMWISVLLLCCIYIFRTSAISSFCQWLLGFHFFEYMFMLSNIFTFHLVFAFAFTVHCVLVSRYSVVCFFPVCVYGFIQTASFVKSAAAFAKSFWRRSKASIANEQDTCHEAT